MAIVLAVLLGLCALAFVLYPLYKQRAFTGSASARTAATEDEVVISDGVMQPTEREQAARMALQEVELDFQLGNISQSDYNQLRGRYTQRALVALKQRYDREQELDAAIEEQVRQMRMQEEQEQEKHGETTE